MIDTELRRELIIALDDLSIGDLDYPGFAKRMSDLAAADKTHESALERVLLRVSDQAQALWDSNGEPVYEELRGLCMAVMDAREVLVGQSEAEETRHRGSCRVHYAEGVCTCGAAAEETCGRFYARPEPLDYLFCYRPKGHVGECEFEARRSEAE